MIQVEVFYEETCPNVVGTRTNLIRAFSSAGLVPRWREYRLGAPDAPPYAQGYGSPTILVNGRDLEAREPDEHPACRLYAEGGVPRVELIERALLAATGGGLPTEPNTFRPGGWRGAAGVLPGVGIALLPKVACPLCWPAYAGVLSTLGLSFLMEDRWLLPISALLLLAAVSALAWRAKRRRGYRPFAIGALAAVVVLVSKFALEAPGLMYAGVAALLGAALWNAWPIRNRTRACTSCSLQELKHEQAND